MKKFVRLVCFDSQNADKEIWINKNFVVSIVPLTPNTCRVNVALNEQTAAYNVRISAAALAISLNS